MNRLIGIGLEDAALILKRSHGSNSRSGILHAVGMVVAGARRVGEVIDPVALEDEGCLEDVLQLGVRDEPFL